MDPNAEFGSRPTYYCTHYWFFDGNRDSLRCAPDWINQLVDDGAIEYHPYRSSRYATVSPVLIVKKDDACPDVVLPTDYIVKDAIGIINVVEKDFFEKYFTLV